MLDGSLTKVYEGLRELGIIYLGGSFSDGSGHGQTRQGEKQVRDLHFRMMNAFCVKIVKCKR